MMEKEVYSVTQVAGYLRRLLEENPFLQNIWIEGEISNLTVHRSGHLYFSIKDENSTINAIMFKGYASKLDRDFPLKNGTKVVAKCSLTVYEPQTRTQINVVAMEEQGIGDLYLKFKRLKEMLEKEGLFDPNRKKPIPTLPKVIGVLTSRTGAAVHDIMTTLKRRYPMAKILFNEILVQGEGAPLSIVRGIELMNRYHLEKEKIDVLIVGRGGGSIEDLWGFNDEKVARTIYKSNIPIISAVGHETDFTIADFVADLRAPTPTGAAEMATSISINEIKHQFTYLEQNMQMQMKKHVRKHRDAVYSIERQLKLLHPKKKWETDVQRLDRLHDQLVRNMNQIIERKKNKFDRLITKLDLISPLKTMRRGYGIPFKDNQIVRSVNQVHKGDHVKLMIEDGEIDLIVENKKGENRHGE